MKIRSVKLEDKYIPEFNGNKDAPLAEQVVVHIKDHISNLQLANYKKFNFEPGGGYNVEYDHAQIFARHIGKIENLEDDDGPIDSGVKLADSKNKALYPLMVEIRNYLLNAGEAMEAGES